MARMGTRGMLAAVLALGFAPAVHAQEAEAEAAAAADALAVGEVAAEAATEAPVEAVAPEPAPEPAPIAAAPVAPPPPTMAVPVDASVGRLPRKEAPVALLPNMELRWALRSKTTATGGVIRKHKSSKEIVAPMDQAVLERVLVALQDDLAARFEAAGWQAMTRAELGADVPSLKTLSPDGELGVPMFKYDDNINELDYAVFALPGAAPVNQRAISNGMAMGRYLHGKQGINLSVSYQFAPGTVAETDSKQLGTQVGSGLWFNAQAALVGASSGGWGHVNMRAGGMVVEDAIGTLAELEGSRSGTAENVIRFLGGMGGRDHTGYQMTPDWAAAEAAMLRAGQAFNAAVVKQLTGQG